MTFPGFNEAQNKKNKKENIVGMKHIWTFLGKWVREGEKSEGVRQSEGGWNWALWNLVGTSFLASSEMNKAKKQILKDLKGPKWFSGQSLFRFDHWYCKSVQDQSIWFTKTFSLRTWYDIIMNSVHYFRDTFLLFSLSFFFNKLDFLTFLCLVCF